MSGLATASPTTVIEFTFSSSTACHTASGSSEPGMSVVLPPPSSHMSDVHCAAACMSGAIGR